MHQLPGSFAPPRRGGPPPGAVLIALLALIVLVAPAAWFAIERLSPRPESDVSENSVLSVSNRKVVSESGSGGGLDQDTGLHLAHLRDKLVKMELSCRKAQDLVRLVAPNLDRNHLQLQRRRLESADAQMETVRREAEESLEEVEMIISHVRKD